MTTATAPSSNETLMREGYAALGRGDMDTVRKIFARDCVTHIPGNNPLSGTKEGVEELVSYFGQLMERSRGTFTIDLQQVTSNETHVVGFHHETGHKGDLLLNNQLTVVCRVEAGQVRECWVFYFDQRQADAFWA